MKIVYLLDNFPPDSWTSVGILTLELAKKLVARGHQIFIITTVQDKEKAGLFNYEGLTVYKIYTDYRLRWRAYVSLCNYQAVRETETILKEIKPDVCHFQHIHQYLSYYCFKIGKRQARAVFLTAHDTMLFSYGKLLPKKGTCLYRQSNWERIKQAKKGYNPLRNLIIRHYLKYVDKIFCVANWMEKSLEINGIRNAATIYNSVDPADWQINFQEVDDFGIKNGLLNKKVVLFGGRLSGPKGGEVILKAMALVFKKMPEAILLIAGSTSKEFEKKMAGFIEDLGIAGKIKFLGWLSRAEIKKAFFACDVCVTPSVYCDPFNLFNIEAAMAKKPVVGTCFGGTPEIVIDGQTGYIVNPQETEKLAEKIIELLKNPQKAKQFGEAGYERIKNKFVLEKQAEETLNWYQKFLK